VKHVPLQSALRSTRKANAWIAQHTIGAERILDSELDAVEKSLASREVAGDRGLDGGFVLIGLVVTTLIGLASFAASLDFLEELAPQMICSYVFFVLYLAFSLVYSAVKSSRAVRAQQNVYRLRVLRAKRIARIGRARTARLDRRRWFARRVG